MIFIATVELRKKNQVKRLSMVQIFLIKITCNLEQIESGALHHKSEQSKRFESDIIVEFKISWF